MQVKKKKKKKKGKKNLSERLIHLFIVRLNEIPCILFCFLTHEHLVKKLSTAPCCWADPCSVVAVCVWAWEELVVGFSQQNQREHLIFASLHKRQLDEQPLLL